MHLMLCEFGQYGKTPLHWGAKNGNAVLVRLLVESGANIHATDDKARTSVLSVLVVAVAVCRRHGQYQDSVVCGACVSDPFVCVNRDVRPFMGEPKMVMWTLCVIYWREGPTPMRQIAMYVLSVALSVHWSWW